MRRAIPLERVGRWANDAFVALVVALQAGALAPWFASGRGVGDGLVLQGAFAAVYAVAAGLLLVRLARRRRVRATWWMLWPLAYMTLATASITWSDLPELTLRRVVALAGTLAFAWWVAETMTPRRALKNVAMGLSAIAAASFALLVLAPQIAIHQGGAHVGDWRGALLHKNLLGREMALATTLALGLAVSAWRRERRRWLLVAAATALLVLGARSATGLVLLMAGAAAMALAALPAVGARERMGRRVLVASTITLVLALVASFGWLMLDALGRDATFTGRDRIWEVTIAELGSRPWTGAGFGAFWEGPGGAAVSRALDYYVGHAHNGLLQAATSLGIPGVLMIVMVYASVFVRVLKAPGFATARPAALGFLVHVALLSVTDAIMSGPNSLSLSVVVAFALMPARAHRQPVAASGTTAALATEPAVVR